MRVGCTGCITAAKPLPLHAGHSTSDGFAGDLLICISQLVATVIFNRAAALAPASRRDSRDIATVADLSAVAAANWRGWNIAPRHGAAPARRRSGPSSNESAITPVILPSRRFETWDEPALTCTPLVNGPFRLAALCTNIRNRIDSPAPLHYNAVCHDIFSISANLRTRTRAGSKTAGSDWSITTPAGTAWLDFQGAAK